MTKDIVIISESVVAGDFYKSLLLSLFGSTIQIVNFCTDRDPLTGFPAADLYVVGATSSNIFGKITSFIEPDKNVVVVTLTFLKEQFEHLRHLPEGSRVMLVNLSLNMAIESIAELNWLGITQVDFIPVYPGMQDIPQVDFAVTPGEMRFMPPHIRDPIDIGHRVFTSATITEIALKLGFNWFLKSERYRTYIATLVEPVESVSMLWMESMRMENYLDILMGALDTGILGVDMEDKIFAANSIAQTITGVTRENMVGKQLADALPALEQVLEEEGRGEKISRLLQLNDTHITMSTAPVIWQGDRVGCFILLQRFTEEEKRQHQFRLQLYQRGYKSKYTFDDIVGESIERTKVIAMKMAHTDASILLTGESGTGKELFAHSIHNASRRRDMPFVAINCAALPETLLESELFGYAEGAFTGAKKGGKLGLFEYAHRGTLFLDEIEGMSPNLQIKLLRVLQEREMMRVGDDRIISIDVRIIAASNENLLEMVHKGTFRKDLYYRLNTLPINIPPLRERGEDLFVIMDSIQKKLGTRFALTPQAKTVFQQYPWEGNVRELSNIVEFLRFAGKETIDVEDLPPVMFTAPPRAPRALSPPLLTPDAPASLLDTYTEAARGREESYTFVMRTLGAAKVGVGRYTICQAAREEGISLTEQEIRGILTKLNSLGLASVSKGRGGSRLTATGKQVLQQLQSIG